MIEAPFGGSGWSQPGYPNIHALVSLPRVVRIPQKFFASSAQEQTERGRFGESSYTDKNVEMKAINRQIKLISKIDQAIKKIENGTYGFCEETGEPIGIKRLIARPVATLCIAAQEKHEKEEKIYADL